MYFFSKQDMCPGFCPIITYDWNNYKKQMSAPMLGIINMVTIHGLADKENPAVIDSGVFAWLIEVPVYF